MCKVKIVYFKIVLPETMRHGLVHISRFHLAHKDFHSSHGLRRW